METFGAPFLSCYISPGMNSQIFNGLSFEIDWQGTAV